MSSHQKLEVKDIQLVSDESGWTLSAKIDGDEVFFRTPVEFPLYRCAEGFIAIALMEAMISNRTIVIDSSTPVSERFRRQFRELQSIYACWNRDLHIVDLNAVFDDSVADYSRIGSFFSAGVDSSHTFAANRDEITHLIMCWGFDSGNNAQDWQQRIAAQKLFVESMGKQLIPVVSNAREWLERRLLTWRMGHGLFLSAVGGLLGMKKVFIPASHTYTELFPWGTHPLSDPLWSTESTQVIHHGAYASRSGKIEAVLKQPEVADNLQVCWRSIHKNCGTCAKCVRTALAVQLLGGKVASLPSLNGLTPLKVLKPNDEGLAGSVEDLIYLAKRKGNEKVYKRLKRYYKQYQLKQFVMSADRLFLGGSLRKLYRKWKRPEHLKWRVTMEGHNRWDI